ncbi:MarR Transcriptional regulators [Rhabdaerophilaceae bacterium]
MSDNHTAKFSRSTSQAAGSSALSDDRPGELQPVEPIQLETFLPYRLNVLATTVSHALARLYSEQFGLSIPEWRSLATLGQFGEITAREIGLHSRMHKTTVSRAIAALERRGFVARRQNQADMRESILFMTPSGESVYAQIVPLARSFDARIRTCMSTTDQATLDELMNHILATVTRQNGLLQPKID